MTTGVWVREVNSKKPLYIEISKDKFISILMQKACNDLKLPLPCTKYDLLFEGNKVLEGSLTQELTDRTSPNNPALIIPTAGKLSSQ